jgi:hypothetical protein
VQQNSNYHLKVSVTLCEEAPSRVRRLIGYIPGTLENVAPNKFNELVKEIGTGNLTLEIFESPNLVHCFQPDKKIIWLSTRPLELLWAQAYAYWVWYSEVLATEQPRGQEIDPHRSPEVHRALELLRWATEEMVNSRCQPWPDDAPSLESEPENQSCAHVAQELSLFAVGFILHHELSHHRFGHQAVEDIDQERDADYGAMAWIMEKIGISAPEFTKRALGASVALLYLITKGIYTGQHGGRSHPKDYNRLIFSLEPYVPRDCDEVWAFVAGILSLHMQNAGIRPTAESHDSFYEWCNRLVEDLAERERLLGK